MPLDQPRRRPPCRSRSPSRWTTSPPSSSPAIPPFALRLEAQARGHELFHYTPDRLSLRDGKVFARVEPMEVRDVKGDHFTLGEPVRIDLSEHGRGAAAPGSALRHGLHHHHASARAHPSEDAGGQRPGLGAQRAGKDLRHRIRRPDAADADHPRSGEIAAFREEHRRHHRQAALRQWRRRRLPSRTRTTATSPRCSKCSARCSASPSSSQRYLPDVRKGDKRIILVDGEPVGAINRVPAEHDARSNMHVGGRAEKTELTAREREICAAHRPVAARARLHLRRHRRHRRLHDRDQRHLADRHPRGQEVRRRRHRRPVLGRGGGRSGRSSDEPLAASVSGSARSGGARVS